MSDIFLRFFFRTIFHFSLHEVKVLYKCLFVKPDSIWQYIWCIYDVALCWCVVHIYFVLDSKKGLRFWRRFIDQLSIEFLRNILKWNIIIVAFYKTEENRIGMYYILRGCDSIQFFFVIQWMKWKLMQSRYFVNLFNFLSLSRIKGFLWN